MHRRLRPLLLTGCWLAVVAACGDSHGDTDLTLAGDARPRRACGRVDAPVAHPCCPVSWAGGESCAAADRGLTCWGPCVAAGTEDDAGAGYFSSQLSCNSDGVINAGHGLFMCVP